MKREQRYRRVVILAAVLFVAFSTPCQGPTEEQVKAAYLFNFAKFVEWPIEVFQKADSPLTFCTLGRSAVVDELDSFLQGKNINGRTVTVRHIRAVEEIKSCHVVFLTPSAGKQQQKLILTSKGLPVLLIGDIDGFAKAGGMINFIVDRGKIVFQINVAAAEDGHLKVSSKMLALAQIVQSSEERRAQ